MIDTPGHVDFTYEVSRSLEACEGAILLVDAAQGIEAQTLANLYLAMDADLHVIPVLNKIDLPGAQPEKYAAEIAGIIGGDPDDVLRVSAKTGQGVEALLNPIVDEVPPPAGRPRRPAARADLRLGLRHLPRRRHLRPRVRRQAQPPRQDQDDVHRRGARDARGRRHLARAGQGRQDLGVGEVGYLITGVKEVRQSRVGDTVTSAIQAAPRSRSAATSTRTRWCSPACTRSTATTTRPCATRWRSCSSTTPRWCTSRSRPGALGFGFRIGFLGLLHLEIVRERLEREFNLDLISHRAERRLPGRDGGRQRASS